MAKAAGQRARLTLSFRPMRVLFGLCVAAIVYGSLYPFAFVAGGHGPSVADFFGAWADVPSRGDVFGNLFLFLPYGLIGAFVIAWRPLVVSGLALSAILQVAQFWVAFRAPQIQDVFWNGLGMVAGVLIAHVPGVEHAFRNADRSRWLSPAALLIYVWLLTVAVPFVPSIDFASFKNSLKPLLKDPQFDPAGTFMITAIWLAVACLVTKLWAERTRQVAALVGLMALSFMLEILIIRNEVTLADALGAFVAFVLWVGLLQRLSARAAVAAGILIVATLWVGLEPFEWRSAPARFYWLPFTGAMYGALLEQIEGTLLMAFLYGAPVYLLVMAGRSITVATALVAAVGLLVESAQVYIHARTPESTPAVIALIVGGLLAYRRSLRQDVADAPDGLEAPPGAREPT